MTTSEALLRPPVRPLPAGFLRPDWALPPGTGALLTTREGGVSKGAYGRAGADANLASGLNLGLHCGDDPAAVLENRARLVRALDGRPVAWLDQCHGAEAVLAGAAIAAAARGQTLRADAVLSEQPGEVCTIMVADCLPVLMCDRNGRAVAAAHAGWRGLCLGVLENSAGAIARLSGRTDALAWLGPSIGPASFEVGAEVREAFIAASLPAERDATVAAFLPVEGVPGKFYGDLPALARLRLARAGILDVGQAGICTVQDARRFYSYRRDQQTGRFAVCIWRD